MRRNIVVVFLLYLIINLITYWSFLLICGPIIDQITSIHLQLLVGSIYIISTGLLYYFMGKKFLVPTGNRKGDLISVWWLSLFLLIYNIFAYFIFDSESFGTVGFFINSLNISVGFSFGAYFQELYGIEPVYFVALISPLVPSLGFWLGMYRRNRTNKAERRDDSEN